MMGDWVPFLVRLPLRSLYPLGMEPGRCRRWGLAFPRLLGLPSGHPSPDSGPGLLLLLEGSSTVHRDDLARDVVSLSHQEQDGPGDVHR